MREEAEAAMWEEAEEEASDEPVDDLGRAIADVKINCEVIWRRRSCSTC